LLEQKNIEEKFEFEKSEIPLTLYNFKEKGIEICDGENHVDFANSRLIYCIWPSVTQEELILKTQKIFTNISSKDKIILI